MNQHRARRKEPHKLVNTQRKEIIRAPDNVTIRVLNNFTEVP